MSRSRPSKALDLGRPVLVFEDASGRQVDLPLELPAAELLRHLVEPMPMPPTTAAPRGPGRPRLGVVAREVTLLPRHWDWLAAQPGGASVALRKLVDDARKAAAGGDRRRASQEAAYRFLQALAGDLPLYEEACRALFAGDIRRFENHPALAGRCARPCRAARRRRLPFPLRRGPGPVRTPRGSIERKYRPPPARPRSPSSSSPC